MMIKAKATIDSQVYLQSDEKLSLAQPWDKVIASFSAPTRSLTKNSGGWLKSDSGKIDYFAGWFGADELPPEGGDLEVYCSNDGITDILVFDGTTLLDTFGEDRHRYRLNGNAFTQTFAKGQVLDGTLIQLFQTGCTALGLMLDSTLVRTPTPAIVHTMSRDALVTDVLAGVAATKSHLFWIDPTTTPATLYLADMFTDNGERDLGRKFSSPLYTRPYGVKEITADMSSGTTVVRMSSYSSTSTLSIQPYHTTQSVVETDLDNILTLFNHKRVSVTVDLDNIPQPGERVTFTDHLISPAVEAWLRVRSYKPDINARQVTISGEGGWAKI